VDAGARLAAGCTYEQLFYKPTVLTEVTPHTPAWTREFFANIEAFTETQWVTLRSEIPEYPF
jgi:benzaldehyde dehydrogenase (NAD)